MKTKCSRREILGAMGMAAGASFVRPFTLQALTTPTSSVTIGTCQEYNRTVMDVLSRMFDQLGGLDALVRGKTVAVKLNLTGTATDRLHYLPPEMTHWVHPQVIWATIHLLGRAGARRIRLLESPWATAEPLEDFISYAGWRAGDLLNAAPRVEFENTNYLGAAKTYSTFWVPRGGLMFKGYDLNHSYEDCDVFVSMAKLKEHRTTGITLSMKNCFGITPCTIYGDNAPEDEPGLTPHGGRGPFHSGDRWPPKSAPPAVDANAPREAGYRVPRIVADLVAARPVHLAVIDGIHTMSGGELPVNSRSGRPTLPVHPGVLIAGRNCLSTDAVAMAVMGFDPMAKRGTPPFETSDNMLELAEQLGVGTRDLNRIEVVGTPLSRARFQFSRPPGSHA
jgi:uncharacterized protein (DUF362 family)